MISNDKYLINYFETITKSISKDLSPFSKRQQKKEIFKTKLYETQTNVLRYRWEKNIHHCENGDIHVYIKSDVLSLVPKEIHIYEHVLRFFRKLRIKDVKDVVHLKAIIIV